jgi:uncharacterized membrane protein YfcA
MRRSGSSRPRTSRPSAVLAPLAVAATFAGVRLVRRVPIERFYGIIYGLLLAVGGKLVHQGWTGL